MSSVLAVAQAEFFRRPPEEQFGSFDELRTSAAQQRRRCDEVESREKAIMFSDSGEVYFGDQHTLSLTHYSMGQLAAMARVPMLVLARLGPETRASVLNQCFPRGKKFKIGLTDGNRLRAVTSDRYERVSVQGCGEVAPPSRWMSPSLRRRRMGSWCSGTPSPDASSQGSMEA